MSTGQPWNLREQQQPFLNLVAEEVQALFWEAGGGAVCVYVSLSVTDRERHTHRQRERRTETDQTDRLWLIKELRMSFKFPFLFTVQHQVRYLLEWTDEDLDEEEDAVSAADLEFCHPLCQCPKCAPAQKVWFASIARGGGSKADSSFSPWESCFSASYFPSGRWWVFPDTWWGLGSSGWREATLVQDPACAARLLSGRTVSEVGQPHMLSVLAAL